MLPVDASLKASKILGVPSDGRRLPAPVSTSTAPGPMTVAARRTKPAKAQDPSRPRKLKALQIVRQPGTDEEVLSCGPEVEQALKSWDEHSPIESRVNLVCIFGKMRQGKSFLMNLLHRPEAELKMLASLRQQSGEPGVAAAAPSVIANLPPSARFDVAHQLNSLTRGVDLSSEVLDLTKWSSRADTEVQSAPKILVGLMDAEGQGEEGDEYDVQLITPALMVSKAVLLNWQGAPRPGEILDHLSVVSRCGERIDLTNGKDGGDNDGGTTKVFRHLHVVFRDWSFLPEDGKTSEQQAFERVFAMTAGDSAREKQMNVMREQLFACFETIDCHCLPRPSANCERVIPHEELAPKFVAGVIRLHQALSAQLRTPTYFAEGALTPRLVAGCLRTIVETSNNDENLRVYGIFEQIQRQELHVALQESMDWVKKRKQLLFEEVTTRKEGARQAWLRDRGELDRLWSLNEESAVQEFERQTASLRLPELLLKDATRQLRNLSADCRRELQIYRNAVSCFLAEMDETAAIITQLKDELERKNELIHVFEQRKEIVMDPEKHMEDAKVQAILAKEQADEALTELSRASQNSSVSPCDLTALERVSRQLRSEADWRQTLAWRIQHGEASTFDERDVAESEWGALWPRGPAEITAGWLSSLLKETVDSFVFHNFNQGVLSEVVVVYIVYAEYGDSGSSANTEESQRPERLVLKFAGTASAELAADSAAYATEIMMFRGFTTPDDPLFAHKANLLRTPEVMAIFSNQDLGKLHEDQLSASELRATISGLQFCIVIKYLGKSQQAGNWTNFEQSLGMSQEEVVETASPIARMHASFWQHPVCDLKWLNARKRSSYHLFDGLGAHFRESPRALYTQILKNLLSAKQHDTVAVIRSEGAQRVYQYLIRPSASDRAKLWQGMYAILDSRPVTLIHGDLRAANVFVRPSAAADGGANEYAFIDWQAAHGCAPGIEMLNWLVFNRSAGDVEAGYFHNCLKTYYSELTRWMAELHPDVDLGSVYPYEHLLEDFAIAVVLFWAAMGHESIVDLMQFNANQLKADQREGKLDKDVLVGLGGLLHALENIDIFFNGNRLEMLERVAKTVGVELPAYEEGYELAVGLEESGGGGDKEEEEEGYDFFMSHCQATGGDQVYILYLSLKARGYRVWVSEA
eukprot:g1689.t1